jgi:hypothetical protein
MNGNCEKVVRVPNVPNTTRETDNSIFNSVGFYQGLQENLEDQRNLLLQVLQRNHRRDE